MNDLERLAAENARLKAVLAKQGFKITYNAKTGDIARISAPRTKAPRHTATTWARKKGIKMPLGMVRRLTKDKAITERKFKNMVERTELIKDAKQYLAGNGFKIPDKFFNKVPTYVLKNTDFYENVNAILNSTAESDADELDNTTLKYSMETSVDRIRRANQRQKAAAPPKVDFTNKKKPKAPIRIKLR